VAGRRGELGKMGEVGWARGRPEGGEKGGEGEVSGKKGGLGAKGRCGLTHREARGRGSDMEGRSGMSAGFLSRGWTRGLFRRDVRDWVAQGWGEEEGGGKGGDIVRFLVVGA